MRKSRLSQYKQNKLIELFVIGVIALTAAQLANATKAQQTITSTVYVCLIYQNSRH
ncbi:Uncharacterised protein [Kingella potus]|uniref:Uncharacterized protein n=1 Tax=Kingella potus TaxID=265175 RepID=A0A377QZ29_9NEIS|nr:Uncharacterised protein [Kingella potus]